jgi:hypothetical protein
MILIKKIEDFFPPRRDFFSEFYLKFLSHFGNFSPKKKTTLATNEYN